MQAGLYSTGGIHETHEKKFFRLSQKWTIEAELWMTFIILMELVYILNIIV